MMSKYRFAAVVMSVGLGVVGSAVAAEAGADCAHGAGKAGRGPGARFAEMDRDGDGKVNLAELTQSREAWLSKVDANKDGVATREEIEASFAAARKERLAQMFSERDANKDGRLARDESHMPSAWFERADANKDGTLTSSELSDARKQQPGRGRHGGGEKGKHARFDANGDGKVDRTELQSAAAREFGRLDRNGDGSLTSDEFRSGRGHGHGRHRKGASDAAPRKGSS